MSNNAKLIEESGHLFRIPKYISIAMLSGLVNFIPATLLAVELILLIVTLFVVQASRRESNGRT